jgi:hypothetical protein
MACNRLGGALDAVKVLSVLFLVLTFSISTLLFSSPPKTPVFPAEVDPDAMQGIVVATPSVEISCAPQVSAAALCGTSSDCQKKKDELDKCKAETADYYKRLNSVCKSSIYAQYACQQLNEGSSQRCDSEERAMKECLAKVDGAPATRFLAMGPTPRESAPGAAPAAGASHF